MGLLHGQHLAGRIYYTLNDQRRISFLLLTRTEKELNTLPICHRLENIPTSLAESRSYVALQKTTRSKNRFSALANGFGRWSEWVSGSSWRACTIELFAALLDDHCPASPRRPCPPPPPPPTPPQAHTNHTCRQICGIDCRLHFRSRVISLSICGCRLLDTDVVLSAGMCVCVCVL